MFQSDITIRRYAATTCKYVFNMSPGDTYWCTADCGWITGHTYLTYGPLLNGAASVIFEGVPTYPDVGRMWDVVAKNGVKQFYTAPTAIRALMVHGDEPVKKHDRSSLEVSFFSTFGYILIFVLVVLFRIFSLKVRTSTSEKQQASRMNFANIFQVLMKKWLVVQILGTVGEPINPEAWKWYDNVVGEGHCPIMDTWWQVRSALGIFFPAPVVP